MGNICACYDWLFQSLKGEENDKEEAGPEEKPGEDSVRMKHYL